VEPGACGMLSMYLELTPGELLGLSCGCPPTVVLPARGDWREVALLAGLTARGFMLMALSGGVIIRAKRSRNVKWWQSQSPNCGTISNGGRNEQLNRCTHRMGFFLKCLY